MNLFKKILNFFFDKIYNFIIKYIINFKLFTLYILLFSFFFSVQFFFILENKIKITNYYFIFNFIDITYFNFFFV